jgi:hypothetical protein
MDSAVAGQRGDHRIERRLLGGAFELKPLEPQTLKGFDAPFPAWAVVCETETVSLFEAAMPRIGPTRRRQAHWLAQADAAPALASAEEMTLAIYRHAFWDLVRRRALSPMTNDAVCRAGRTSCSRSRPRQSRAPRRHCAC